jgi:hypothetical protein
MDRSASSWRSSSPSTAKLALSGHAHVPLDKLR